MCSGPRRSATGEFQLVTITITIIIIIIVTIIIIIKAEVSMPALSSTMKEGKIVQWTKKAGDR